MLRRLLLYFLVVVHSSSANEYFEVLEYDYAEFGLCPSVTLDDLEERVLDSLHGRCLKLTSPEIPLGRIRPPAPAMHANNQVRRVVYSMLGSDDPLKRFDEIKASVGFASLYLLQKLLYTAYLATLEDGPELAGCPDARDAFNGRRASCKSTLTQLSNKLNSGINSCTTSDSMLEYVRSTARINTCIDYAILFKMRYRGSYNTYADTDIKQFLEFWLDDTSRSAARIPWVCSLFQIVFRSNLLGKPKHSGIRRPMIQYIIDKGLPEYIELLQTAASNISRSICLQIFKQQYRLAPSPELELFFTNYRKYEFMEDSLYYYQYVNDMVWEPLPQPDDAV
ncbi:hypothetical protein PAPHI01_0642 [Pancytospora philotis]|nr:hypothetical protein PAPHI01_0642 [Pancytospora philotis]